MITRRAWLVAGVIVVLLSVVGCGSATGGASAATSGPGTAGTALPSTAATSGSPVTSPPKSTPTSAETSGPASSETPTETSTPTSTPTSVAGHAFGVCPTVPVSDIHGLSDCVHRNLVSYWQRATDRPINRPVVIEPTFPPEPQACFAPQTIYAYYCPDNSTIYLNTSILTLWNRQFTPEQVPYSLAMTLAHEVGHAAQFAVDPALKTADTTDPDVSKKIELQADCLAGVWAQDQISAGRMDKAQLLAVWRQEVVLLDTAEHRQMHDDPDARLAATERGMAGGTMASCGLEPG